MADTTTKVLEVVVDNNKAVSAISEYNRLIDEQKQKQAALAKAYADGKISQADYYKEMAQSKEVTKTYSRQVQELSKEIQNNIKMDTEKQGSLRALRAELSNVTKQYDELSEEERRAAKGLELQSKINAITASLKSSEQETGRFYRNVGNYANGFVEAFTRMGGSMGGLQGPLNIAKNGFMALSSTPLIAILGALVTIIQKVIQNLKSSEASMQAVTVALAPLNAGGRLLQKTMQALGNGIAKVAERLGKWAEKLGLVTEAMKIEQQLTKDQIALQLREREVIKENADSQLKVSQLRAKAADKLNYSAKERVVFLEQALAEEEAIAKREMELAQERYRIQEEQSKLAENSAEENDQLAQSYAAMRNAEKSYFDKSRELTAQLVEAKKQMAAETAKAADASVAAAEAELTTLIKTSGMTDDEIAKRLEIKKREIDARLKLAEEGSQAEYELRRQQIQAEYELELQKLANEEGTEELIRLRKEQFNQEMLDLEKQRIEDQNQAIIESTRLAYENQIAEMQLQGENTLQMELQMLQAELEALHQLEDESEAEFRERQLEKMKEVADKKKEIADYEVSIEQTKYDAISQITGGLRSVLEAFGEENKAAAKAAKVLALAEIAINTGKALAAGIAQSQSVPFPANIGAIATTITTVLAGIASAISTVKSAKFATGGLVSGPGTGTSDSISARLSNGESVINARSTAMFGPLLSSLNQAGGGVAFNPAAGGQREGYEFLAAAVAAGMKSVDLRVGVDEVTRVQDRVARITEISTIG